MTTTEIMIAKFKERVEREFQFFHDKPEEINLENIDGAIARCFGALCLVTDVLFDLGQTELATELGQHWDEVDRDAFYEILYKSWGC